MWTFVRDWSLQHKKDIPIFVFKSSDLFHTILSVPMSFGLSPTQCLTSSHGSFCCHIHSHISKTLHFLKVLSNQIDTPSNLLSSLLKLISVLFFTFTCEFTLLHALTILRHNLLQFLCQNMRAALCHQQITTILLPRPTHPQQTENLLFYPRPMHSPPSTSHPLTN